MLAKPLRPSPILWTTVIPYIGGEEEKSEQEPLKLWGHIEGDKIVSADAPSHYGPVPARSRF